jgi:hypothetical protein
MASYYGPMPPGFEQAWNPGGPPPVFYEPPMDPEMMAAQMAAQAAAEPYEPRGASPFGQAPYDDPNAFAGNQYVGRSADIAAPVRLEAHGEERVPISAAAQAKPPPPLRSAAARTPRQPGLGRNPDDVKAMRMENARRQYEQRFGMSPMGRGGQRQQSMAASGQQEELDALIARLSQARMAQMANRRTARRG